MGAQGVAGLSQVLCGGGAGTAALALIQRLKYETLQLKRQRRVAGRHAVGGGRFRSNQGQARPDPSPVSGTSGRSVVGPVEVGHMHMDRRASAVHAEHFARAVPGHVLHVVHQEGQRVTIDKDVTLTRDEVLDDVPLLVKHPIDKMVGGAAAAGDRRVSPGAGQTVMTLAALAVSGTGGSDQRHMTTLADDLALGDLDRATRDCGLTEGARYGGLALLVDCVVAGTDVDGVVARGAKLLDYATMVKRQGVVSTTNDDSAAAFDGNAVAATTGNHGTPTENGNVDLTAARNADSCGH